MESRSSPSTNVIRFPGARSSANPSRDQRSLMDAVYAAGSLSIAASDHATKVMATRLTIFGFVVIDELQTDGTMRRLRPSEAFHASTVRPWRISKPSGRYRIDEQWPDAERELFAALLA
ncbi:hypothetical protein KHP60_07440 [Microvirga sp. 3-52]|jgi:hypothetical protein|uniref:hypothetical protein n=1 Tax=Microvirga sp. 3-52 TaxID=2792425 RepID=UPI001AD3EC39|nr:hypothetical protein [Microvirga sp. 3-52]MBO1905976.1 hypothetical protein [Microvirga sp. 3-52]MBS7452182.1 hypothetical protein [Microvirga sp. 3-52]